MCFSSPKSKKLTFFPFVPRRSFQQQMLPEGFPTSTRYGFCGETADSNQTFVSHSPGPTLVVESGTAWAVKVVNELTEPHLFVVDPTLDWANPNNLARPTAPFLAQYPAAREDVAIIAHFHGATVQSTSDGHPRAWYTARGQHGPSYHSVLSTERNATVMAFPNQQPPMWSFFHDHTMGLTRLNVQAGLSSLFRILPPANQSSSLDGLLPTGDFELPLLLSDANFFKSGELYFPSEGVVPDQHPFFVPEFSGPFITVNGHTWPRLTVKRGWYRFLFLNRANARAFNLRLSNEASFRIISSGHERLPKTVDAKTLFIAGAQRYEVLIDFSSCAPGDEIQVLNDARTPSPFGDAVDEANDGRVMLFVVTAADGFRRGEDIEVPDFATLDVRALAADTSRAMTLQELESDGAPLAALLDGLEFDAPVSQRPQYGAVEEWEVINLTGDSHPIHIHLVTVQLVSQQSISVAAYPTEWTALNGPLALGRRSTTQLSADGFGIGERETPSPEQQGWVDVFVVPPGTVVTLWVRWAAGTALVPSPFPFDPAVGPGYVFHCHVLDHEDNSMMRPIALTRHDRVLQGLGYGAKEIVADEFTLRWKVNRDELRIGADVAGATWMGVGVDRGEAGVDWMLLDTGLDVAAGMLANQSQVQLFDMFTLASSPSLFLMDRSHGGTYDLKLESVDYSHTGVLHAVWSRPWTTADPHDADIDYKGFTDMVTII